MISATNIGLKRLSNQDYVKIIKNTTGDCLGILCDGVGGHNSGEVASSHVVEHFVSEFRNLKFTKSVEQYVNWIKENISLCNDLLIKMSEENPQHSGMGTTLVLCIICEDDLIIANVGDSRAYVVDEDSIRQMSEDHTYVNLRVKMGELSLIEAENHPDRNVVMQAIGLEKELYPHIISLDRNKFKQVVLFCDGVTDYVKKDFLEDVLIDQLYDSETKCKVIIEKALEAGGNDNISVVILELEESKKW